MTKEQLQRNYEVRQQNWIKANNLNPGDKVKVLRSHPNQTKGWNNSWTKSMHCQIGNVLSVSVTHGPQGIELSDGFDYPYTVLQKIEE